MKRREFLGSLTAAGILPTAALVASDKSVSILEDSEPNLIVEKNDCTLSTDKDNGQVPARRDIVHQHYTAFFDKKHVRDGVLEFVEELDRRIRPWFEKPCPLGDSRLTVKELPKYHANMLPTFLSTLLIAGDIFIPHIPDPEGRGNFLGGEALFGTHVWRIETIKHRVVEFQYSDQYNYPDYRLLVHNTENPGYKRYKPNELTHIKLDFEHDVDFKPNKEEWLNSMYPYGSTDSFFKSQPADSKTLERFVDIAEEQLKKQTFGLPIVTFAAVIYGSQEKTLQAENGG